MVSAASLALTLSILELCRG